MTIDEIAKMNESYRKAFQPGLDYSSPVFYVAAGIVVFVIVNLLSKRKRT